MDDSIDAPEAYFQILLPLPFETSEFRSFTDFLDHQLCSHEPGLLFDWVRIAKMSGQPLLANVVDHIGY